MGSFQGGGGKLGSIGQLLREVLRSDPNNDRRGENGTSFVEGKRAKAGREKELKCPTRGWEEARLRPRRAPGHFRKGDRLAKKRCRAFWDRRVKGTVLLGEEGRAEKDSF